MRVLLGTILVSLLAYPHSAALGQLSEGQRVRVTYDADRSGIARVMRGATAQSTGTLALADSSHLTISDGPRSRAIAIDQVRRVEISEGRHRQVAKYSLLGALSAAAATAVMYYGIAAPLGAEMDSHNSRVFLQIIGGGAVAGAIAGFAFPEERWRRVSLP